MPNPSHESDPSVSSGSTTKYLGRIFLLMLFNVGSCENFDSKDVESFPYELLLLCVIRSLFRNESAEDEDEDEDDDEDDDDDDID